MYKYMHVQRVRIYQMHELFHAHDTSIQAYTERRSGNTTQRPTNLKRGRSERVSWEEAEKKSTVTVTLLQRRDNGQQL